MKLSTILFGLSIFLAWGWDLIPAALVFVAAIGAEYLTSKNNTNHE